MINNQLAPILLIGFNRPRHFQKTITALSKNDLAIKSDLYISIDGPINDFDFNAQKLILKSINDLKNSFRSVIIFNQKENLGLAKNITTSISKVLTDNKKIIVVEDDIVTSKNFLRYMNDALSFYSDHKKIWHISGHNIYNDFQRKDEIFLWRFMDCWGWGTWKDRWQNFDNSPRKLLENFSNNDIYKFNLDGNRNSWNQVEQNSLGYINTWAIFWYATIFKNNGLCVSPWWSFVKNIGFDGSGVHTKVNIYKNNNHTLNNEGIFKGKYEFKEDKMAFEIMKIAYRPKRSIKSVISNVLLKVFNKEIHDVVKKYYYLIKYSKKKK